MTTPVDAFLRPPRDEDAPAVLDAFASAPDMARQGDAGSLEEAQELIGRLTSGTTRAFAIVVGDRLVGLVAAVVDETNGNGWVFYWMHQNHRGQGLTAAGTATLADWALTDGGLGRLELAHRVNNPASGGVALAAGFVQEGREREKFLIDGERVDVLTYGRLRSDPVPTGPRLALHTS